MRPKCPRQDSPLYLPDQQRLQPRKTPLRDASLWAVAGFAIAVNKDASRRRDEPAVRYGRRALISYRPRTRPRECPALSTFAARKHSMPVKSINLA